MNWAVETQVTMLSVSEITSFILEGDIPAPSDSDSNANKHIPATVSYQVLIVLQIIHSQNHQGPFWNLTERNIFS